MLTQINFFNIQLVILYTYYSFQVRLKNENENENHNHNNNTVNCCIQMGRQTTQLTTAIPRGKQVTSNNDAKKAQKFIQIASETQQPPTSHACSQTFSIHLSLYRYPAIQDWSTDWGKGKKRSIQIERTKAQWIQTDDAYF